MLLATFGPGAALIFGLPSLPASQPLNCFGKHGTPQHVTQQADLAGEQVSLESSVIASVELSLRLSLLSASHSAFAALHIWM